MAGTSGRILFKAHSSASSSLPEAEHAKSTLTPASFTSSLGLPDSLPSRAVALRGEGPDGQRVPTMKESSNYYLFQPTRGGKYAMVLELCEKFQIPIDIMVQDAPVEVPVVSGTVYCNWEKAGRTVVEYWGIGKGGARKSSLPFDHLRFEVWGLKTHRSVETKPWEQGYQFQKGAFWFEHESDEIYEISIFCQDTEVFSATVSPGSGIGGGKGKGGGDGGWTVLVSGTAVKGGFKALLDRVCFVGETIGCTFRKGLTKDLKVSLLPIGGGGELEPEVNGQGMVFSPKNAGRYLCVFRKGEQKIGACPVDILDGGNICGRIKSISEAFSTQEVAVEVEVSDKKWGLDLTAFLKMECFSRSPSASPTLKSRGKGKGKSRKGGKIPFTLTYGNWEEENGAFGSSKIEGAEEKGTKMKKAMRGEFVADGAGDYEVGVIVSLVTPGKEVKGAEVQKKEVREKIKVEDLGEVLAGSIQCGAKGDVGRPHRVNARIKNSRTGKVFVSEDIRVVFNVTNKDPIEATTTDWSHFEFVMKEPGLGVVDVTWRGKMMGRKAVSFQHNIEDLKSEVIIPDDIRIGKEQAVVVSLRNTRTNEALRVIGGDITLFDPSGKPIGMKRKKEKSSAPSKKAEKPRIQKISIPPSTPPTPTSPPPSPPNSPLSSRRLGGSSIPSPASLRATALPSPRTPLTPVKPSQLLPSSPPTKPPPPLTGLALPIPSSKAPTAPPPSLNPSPTGQLAGPATFLFVPTVAGPHSLLVRRQEENIMSKTLLVKPEKEEDGEGVCGGDIEDQRSDRVYLFNGNGDPFPALGKDTIYEVTCFEVPHFFFFLNSIFQFFLSSFF